MIDPFLRNTISDNEHRKHSKPSFAQSRVRKWKLTDSWDATVTVQGQKEQPLSQFGKKEVNNQDKQLLTRSQSRALPRPPRRPGKAQDLSRSVSSTESLLSSIMRRICCMGELEGSLSGNVSKFSRLADDVTSDYKAAVTTTLIQQKGAILKLINDIASKTYSRNFSANKSSSKYKNSIFLESGWVID